MTQKISFSEKWDYLVYLVFEDVFVPEIGIKESREGYRKRLKQIREAALPKNWKGIVS